MKRKTILITPILILLINIIFSGAVNAVDPILSNGTISPTSGSRTSKYVFTVDYYDADGDEPKEMNFVQIQREDGVYEYNPKLEIKEREDGKIIFEGIKQGDGITKEAIKPGTYRCRFFVQISDTRFVAYPMSDNYETWPSFTVTAGTPKSVLKFGEGLLAKILDYFPNAFPLIRMLLKL